MGCVAGASAGANGVARRKTTGWASAEMKHTPFISRRKGPNSLNTVKKYCRVQIRQVL